MATIKYGVWFHGTTEDPQGICYKGKSPYFTSEKYLAEDHRVMLQSGVDEPALFSVCMLIVEGD